MVIALDYRLWILRTPIWYFVTVLVMIIVVEVTSLSGPNVCIEKQKYNITKRVKYRAPMSVRTYEWCFAMPPRCSRWSTEMRDLTRVETEERTAETAVCCPGYKVKDVSCVPICPLGKTGPGCSDDCPLNKWGPNCVHECKKCEHGTCSPTSGECLCQDGWQGESCETIARTTTSVPVMEQLLTSVQSTASTKTTSLSTTPVSTSTEMTSISTTVPVTYFPTNNFSSSMVPISSSTVSSNLPNNSAKQTTNADLTIATTAFQPIDVYKNMTLSNVSSRNLYNVIPETKTEIFLDKNSSQMETKTTDVFQTTITSSTSEPKIMKIDTEQTTLPISSSTTETTLTNSISTMKPSTTISTTEMTKRPTFKTETTRKSEVTSKQSTTSRFKPKEIWIRPAQKGESPMVAPKVNYEFSHSKSKTREISTAATTSKTIIVSIIPTSISYTPLKKVALSTATKINNASIKLINRSTEQSYTKPMTAKISTASFIITRTTLAPFTTKVQSRKVNTSTSINPLLVQNVTKTKSYQSFSTEGTSKATLPTAPTTNSMSITSNVSNKYNTSFLTTTPYPWTNFFNKTKSITTKFSTNVPHTTDHGNIKSTLIPKPSKPTTKIINVNQNLTNAFINVTDKPAIVIDRETQKITRTLVSKQAETNVSQQNLTDANSTTNPVTEIPAKDEEVFHILTEPEHITAVMGEKERERTSVDLISVITIVGGLMMAVITIAVVIVMVERCKKPRYEDVRKYNDIRMQVMIDNNDVPPPPYVRSIFHTPLPEPPTSEKGHYQPISTLDRNLKQFMRPVVVQTISPLMLENFRGILECHYDHLPRRSHDLGQMPTRCSVATSAGEREELLPQRVHSLTDSDIEAMKCEAKQDVIDHTTSEPLYAEIPCWRPPSEHAVEVVNLNGEAVTEL